MTPICTVTVSIHLVTHQQTYTPTHIGNKLISADILAWLINLVCCCLYYNTLCLMLFDIQVHMFVTRLIQRDLRENNETLHSTQLKLLCVTHH